MKQMFAIALSSLVIVAQGCGSGEDTGPAGGTAGSGGGASGSGGGTSGTGGGTGGSGGVAGEGGSGGTSPQDAGPDSSFDPTKPGLRLSYTIGVALMMGQPATFAAGAFMITGREDLEPPPAAPEVPLETCEAVGGAYVPSCTGPQDCAPEQQCVPETDMDGKPIAGSEHCATPRGPLDVGPFTVEGFASGPLTMQYNPGQNGAYTTPGGDGTIPYEQLVFDTTYTFHGAGDAAQGLGAFTGELYLSPELALSSPAMITLPMGTPGIQVSASQDLVLVWDGSDPGAEVVLTLTGASMSGESSTVTCRTLDAGTFTIPAGMVAAANLGDMAFLNMLTIDRTGTGTVSGDGLTSHDISAVQTLVLNVAKLP